MNEFGLFLLDPMVLRVALLGGFLALDSSAAFQFMLSRPLVAGWLVGLVCGDGTAGLSLGCLLELLWVNTLPVGAFVPPDLTLAAVFTVAGTLLLGKHPPIGWPVPPEAATVFLVMVSIPLALFGGILEIRLRRVNVRLGHWVERRIGPRGSGALSYGILVSLGLLFLKTFVLTALSLAVIVPFCGIVLANLPVALLHGLAWMYWLVLMLGLTLFLDLFWSRKFMPHLFAGFAVSWLLIHVARVPLIWMFPCLLATALILVWTAGKRIEQGY